MKKNIQVFSVLFMFVFIISCKGQNNSEIEQTDTSQILQEDTPLKDVDPHFTGTTLIQSANGPSHITRHVLQDKNGHIWLATWEGIIRYDGKSFTNFTNKENLRRYRVFTILEDRNGILWFGTIGAGVYRYDGKSFSNVTSKEGLVNDQVQCLYEDKVGKIWIGTVGGISVFDGSTFHNMTTNDGLTNDDINSIIEDKDGRIWIGTRGDACYLDGTTFTQFTNDGRAFGNVRSIIEDKKGTIWIGGNDGLWTYKEGEFENLSENFVGYIYEDENENIWTSSVSSTSFNYWVLSRYDIRPLPYDTQDATIIKEEKNMFFGMMEDEKGAIWLGHLQGVTRYDGQSFQDFKNVEAKE